MSDSANFGLWLKQRRKDLGLTRKELAERIGCSAVTIEKVEIGERRPSRQIAELLAQEFGVPSGEAGAFLEFARAAPAALMPAGRMAPAKGGVHAAPWRMLARRRNNLPAPPTAFIGREREVVDALALLRRPGVRLATLTGPPGIGKTRMSLRVASEILDDMADGAFFVPLAPVSDPELVPSAIAQCLGVRETADRSLSEALKEYLRDRKMLLVLDNFEQVVPAAPLVAELLMAAPGLQVLVTSREILHLYGEHDLPVPPMSTPGAQDELPVPGTPSHRAVKLGNYEAVRLFSERSKALQPDFSLNERNAPIIAEVCSKLEGLPLAIELAAAQVRYFSLEDILQRLQKRLDLLVGGPIDLPARQRALRSAIDWSYDLLDQAEQLLFRTISVFVGGCTTENAQQVCDLDEDALSDVPALMASLAGKSLMYEEEMIGGDVRFGMLETIREYALEQLDLSGEAEKIRRRHLAYYLDMALAAQPRLLKGPDQETWLQRLELEHDNIRTALGWALEQGGNESALQLAGAIWKFWLTHGHISEGRHWLEMALSVPGAQTAIRAQALSGAGNLAHSCGDYAAARRFYEESLGMRRELGDKQGVASALNNLSLVAHSQGNFAQVEALQEESLALKRELGDRWGIASSLGNLGVLAHAQGNYERSWALHEESLAIRRDLGDKLGIALALGNLGVVALSLGRHAEAHSIHQESLAIRQDLSDKQGTAESLLNLGNVARAVGDYEAAIDLYERCAAICRELGDKMGIAAALHNLGYVLDRKGETERTASLLVESLLIYWDVRDRPGIVACLVGLAGAEVSAGKTLPAARLLGAVDRALEGSPFALHAVDRLEYDRNLAAARAALDEADWDEAWRAGRALPLEQAVTYALDQIQRPRA
jgi:predicted ATPase/transcriptional regulator with XRE-family HTH domain